MDNDNDKDYRDPDTVAVEASQHDTLAVKRFIEALQQELEPKAFLTLIMRQLGHSWKDISRYLYDSKITAGKYSITGLVYVYEQAKTVMNELREEHF